MSRPQEPRPFFHSFGNPFRMIRPKGSYSSPILISLLNSFEETLAQRMRNLKPTNKDDVLSLSWMTKATETLCDTHIDIKKLITDLELPVCDWDEKWIDVYLSNSVKLLDICIAFSSEISRINQGHLVLRCALHNLESQSPNQVSKTRSLLDGWSQNLDSKNPKIENCFAILETLIESLNLPKVKNSSKGKVLMRAMYGVKVVTLFICGVFASSFTGSAKKMTDLPVPHTFHWAEAFNDLQTNVNMEIRGKSSILKELENVDMGVKKLHTMTQNGINPIEGEDFKSLILDIGVNSQKLSQGLDDLTRKVDGFFQIVLTGRDALLCNLRASDSMFEDRKNFK